MSFQQDHDDEMFELFAASDYKREAFGDPCPCGTLRWQADCPNCMHDEQEAAEAERDALLPSAPAPAEAPALLPPDDDDIPF